MTQPRDMREGIAIKRAEAISTELKILDLEICKQNVVVLEAELRKSHFLTKVCELQLELETIQKGLSS